VASFFSDHVEALKKSPKYQCRKNSLCQVRGHSEGKLGNPGLYWPGRAYFEGSGTESIRYSTTNSVTSIVSAC
jgi:hypothetical protein